MLARHRHADRRRPASQGAKGDHSAEERQLGYAAPTRDATSSMRSIGATAATRMCPAPAAP